MMDGEPRRILFVTHTSEWIGPNVSLLELVIRLPGELTPIVAVPGQGRFSEVLAAHAIPVFLQKRIDKYGIPATVSLIRSERIQLVYGNSAHGASKNALLAAKLCGVPFVYHLREMAGSGWHHRRRLFGLADDSIAVSRAAAESYQGSFRSPPHVIHNGVALERFTADRDRCRRELASELGFDPSVPLVVHVGNVYERKGQRMAVESMRELHRRLPDTRLLLAGRLDRDPDYVKRLRETISQYGMEKQAFLLGLREEIVPLLAAADVFLHTAVSDPHPRAVIEAMAAGLPVVALAVDGVAETVEDGETGFLVSPPWSIAALADPLASLLTDRELRRSMGENGLARAERLFSAERTARQVADVILSVLGDR